MQKVFLLIFLPITIQALIYSAQAQQCKPVWHKQSPYIKKQQEKKQFAKGRLMLGVSYSFDRFEKKYNQALETYKARVADLWAVQAGYFVKKNLAIGIQADYKVLPYITKNNIPPGYGGGSLGYESYGAGLFVKRYLKIVPCLFLSLEADVFARRTMTTFRGAKPYILNAPLRIAGAALSPGLVFQPDPRIGIEIKYGDFGCAYTEIYNIDDINRSGLAKYIADIYIARSGFGFNYGLEDVQTWSLSINYYLFRHRKKVFVKYPQDRKSVGR